MQGVLNSLVCGKKNCWWGTHWMWCVVRRTSLRICWKQSLARKVKWLSGRIWRRWEFGLNSGCNRFLMGASKYPLHSMYWQRKLEKTLSWNNQVVEDYKELCCKVTEYNSKGWEAHGGFKISWLHVLMQQVLPLCLCTLTQEETQMSLISLIRVFNKICLKVIDPSMMEVLKEEVAETMWSLEKK